MRYATFILAATLPLLGQEKYAFADAQKFLNTSCKACHFGKGAVGGFDVTKFTAEEPMLAKQREWSRAVLRVKNGEMPPKGAPVPALAAVCESTVAYTGGQRIRLRIGNPMAARLDRLALTVYAGDGAAHGRSAKRLYRELALALAPGEWQSVDIDFDGIDAHDLRELAVRASVGHAALAPR